MGAQRAASPSGKRITLTHWSVRAAETLSELTGDPSSAPDAHSSVHSRADDPRFARRVIRIRPAGALQL
jgi:hypothetical protein